MLPNDMCRYVMENIGWNQEEPALPPYFGQVSEQRWRGIVEARIGVTVRGWTSGYLRDRTGL